MYTKILGRDVEVNARSPHIWNTLSKMLGIDCQMRRQNTSQNELQSELENFRQDPQFHGVLLAAPLKEKALQILQSFGHTKIGNLDSINLIYKSDDGIQTTSTDGFGALASLGLNQPSCNFLIFGYGGTSKSIINAITHSSLTQKITVATRQSKIRESHNAQFKFIEYKEINEYLPNANVIINATNLGNSQFPNLSPINQATMKKVSTTARLLDVNYSASGTTTFLELGKSEGITGIDGSEMNLMQALYAFKITHPTTNLTLEELKILYANKDV